MHGLMHGRGGRRSPGGKQRGEAMLAERMMPRARERLVTISGSAPVKDLAQQALARSRG